MMLLVTNCIRSLSEDIISTDHSLFLLKCLAYVAIKSSASKPGNLLE